MEKNSTTNATPLFVGEAWFDPIEAELRERVRGFLEEMIEQEATAALGRSRYQRGVSRGYRNGTRSRRLLGSFGPVQIAVPRARLLASDGTSREWRSTVKTRSLCPASSSVCKHCKLVSLSDATRGAFSGDRSGDAFLVQVGRPDLIRGTRHHLLGGKDAVLD